MAILIIGRVIHIREMILFVREKVLLIRRRGNGIVPRVLVLKREL